MITLSDAVFCHDPLTPAAVRISAQQRAFGGTGLADFYRQIENGRTTALISALSGAVTLLALEGADFEELRAFLPGVGNHLWCEGDTAAKLGLGSACEGDILCLNGGEKAQKEIGDTRGFEPLSSVYPLLCTQFPLPSFETWYVDLFRNISQGAQRVFSVFEGGEAVSCALLSAVTDEAAILSAVVTNENYRKRGLASECIKKALAFAGARRVFVMTREPSLNGFYEQFGFAPCGRWSETEI